MAFTADYSLKMPISEAILRAIIGIVIVLVILAVIDLLILLVSKIIRAIEARVNGKAATAAETPAPAPVQAPAAESVELIGLDEPTAAVVMAIVSDQSGIPLNRLKFKSIKLLEEKS